MTSLIDNAREWIENTSEDEQKSFKAMLNEFIEGAIESQPEAEQNSLNQLNTPEFRNALLDEAKLKTHPFLTTAEFKR